MKVFIHYEDNENTDLNKSLKITLPKSWKNGPAGKIPDGIPTSDHPYCATDECDSSDDDEPSTMYS